jgi:hypothetical protein
MGNSKVSARGVETLRDAIGGDVFVPAPAATTKPARRGNEITTSSTTAPAPAGASAPSGAGYGY